MRVAEVFSDGLDQIGKSNCICVQEQEYVSFCSLRAGIPAVGSCPSLGIYYPAAILLCYLYSSVLGSCIGQDYLEGFLLADVEKRVFDILFLVQCRYYDRYFSHVRFYTGGCVRPDGRKRYSTYFHARYV